MSISTGSSLKNNRITFNCTGGCFAKLIARFSLSVFIAYYDAFYTLCILYVRDNKSIIIIVILTFRYQFKNKIAILKF